jgi:UDPglucose 6-dehydrogenase
VLRELEICPSPADAIRGADVVVIGTEWPEYKVLDWHALCEAVGQPLVVDGRRLLDPEAMRAIGWRYEAVGSRSLTS